MTDTDLRIINFEINKLASTIKDFNGIKIALYKDSSDETRVIACTPQGEWRYAKSIDWHDVDRSPPWIEDEIK